MMKACVSSYSYSGALRAGQIELIDIIDHAASVGCEGIEFTNSWAVKVDEVAQRRDFAKKLRERSEKVGIPIVAYTVGSNLLLGKDEVARVIAALDIAEILGAKVMRHDLTGGFPKDHDGIRTFDKALPALAAASLEIAKAAEQKGIKSCSENHGKFAQDSDRIVRLVEAVNHKNYGVLCDVGNFACADEDCAVAVGKVAPITFHVHCKDFIIKSGMEIYPGDGFFTSRAFNWLRGTIVGQGNVPVAQCINILRDAGYDGFVSVEFEGLEECLRAITAGVANVNRFIKGWAI